MTNDLVTCPLCGSDQCKHRSDFDAMLGLPFGFPSRIYMCRRCTFKFLHPYFDDDSLIKIYADPYFTGSSDGDNFAPDVGVNYEEDFLSVRLRRFETTLDGLLALRQGGRRILDVGAAYGDFLACARRRGLDVTGVELSKEACQRAKDKHDICLINQKVEDFVPAHSFDFIHMSHVLEHLPDVHLVVERLRDLLVPEGLVYVAVPFQFNLVEQIKYHLFRTIPQYTLYSLHHPVFFTPSTLIRLFHRHGMRPVFISCFDVGIYNTNTVSQRVKAIAWSVLARLNQGFEIRAIFSLTCGDRA